MKAVVFESYGALDGLKLAEIGKPALTDDGVLVRVRASAVNFGNVAHVRGEPLVGRLWSGLRGPNNPVPGGDFAGVVEAVGANVTQFEAGAEVFGDVSDHGFGAFAKYLCAPASTMARKPANVTFGEAAASAQSGLVALQGLRDKGGIQPGQKVLVVGASGGNGTFAVQIAKAFGAEVTGVCGTGNVDLVRSIGADHVIDYTKEDFTQGEQRYDLIFATAGNTPILAYRRALSSHGTYVSAGGEMAQVFQGLLLGPLVSAFGSKRMTSLYAQQSRQDLVTLREMFEAGQVTTVIDRSYPLAEAAEALRYYDEGHTRGKIVITMEA